MNLARVGQGVLVLAVLAGCADAPAESDRDQSIVLTKHASDVDFGKYKTFYLRPEIRTFDDSGALVDIDDSEAQPLLNATSNNLKARGFTPADKGKADLGVELLYTEHISSDYWCYGWWDSYYWGYPGWGYYPYYGCDTVMWKSNMLATSITDLTVAQGNPDGGEGGAGGAGQGDRVPGIWFSGVYGVSLTAPDAVSGINQAFAQSPYIKAAP